MSEQHLGGEWTVTLQQNLENLKGFSIQPIGDSGLFSVTAPGLLDLPQLTHDATQGILMGTCTGQVINRHRTFNVVVVLCDKRTCKGVIFPALGDIEDNTIATWTADRKGGDGSPSSGCLSALFKGLFG
jgi:hypothetical protein